MELEKLIVYLEGRIGRSLTDVDKMLIEVSHLAGRNYELTQRNNEETKKILSMIKNRNSTRRTNSPTPVLCKFEESK